MWHCEPAVELCSSAVVLMLSDGVQNEEVGGEERGTEERAVQCTHHAHQTARTHGTRGHKEEEGAAGGDKRQTITLPSGFQDVR